MSDSAESETTQQSTQPASTQQTTQPATTPPANTPQQTQQHSGSSFNPQHLLDAINSIPEKIVQGLKESTPQAPKQTETPKETTQESTDVKTPGKKQEQSGDSRHWFAKWYQG